MSDFESAREELSKVRRAQSDALLANARASERMKPGTRDQVKQAADATRASLDRFSLFTDPRRNVGQLSDAAPFALFPMRLETRFVSVGTGDNTARQLWVRIYPDDCSIDTFEPDLSVTELKNAKRYWQAIWQAAGVESDQRAAWAALVSAHGSGRAAFIVDTFRPVNDTGPLVFPPDPPTRTSSWSEAPRVTQFPERFVVLGFNNNVQTLEAIGNVVSLPLYVGPDPSVNPTVDPSAAIHPDGPDLFIPDPLQWMVDFDKAVAAGMGLAIDLTAGQARIGFDRLLVIGLQLSASASEGKEALESLLHHHAAGRSGFAIVPQGMPAHNTGGTSTGYTTRDNPDQSFDDRKNGTLFTPTANPLEKRDGQWLAEALGVDLKLFQTIHGADGRDQMHAQAMQHLLWPATIGYWMDKLLTPVFNDDAVSHTRWFFANYVSGRGALPAIRVGDEPYGILPTTAFSRIRWLEAPPIEIGRPLPDSQRQYLHALYTVLRAVDTDWTAMSAQSAHLGPAGDAHQQLLSVIGLHPSSVEFYSRYAESLAELFNTVNLWGIGPQFIQALVALGLHDASAGLLARLGYAGTQRPDIFNHYFLRQANPIDQVIDDRPLSETRPIRAYTDDKRNYLKWLIDAANTSLDAVRLEEGFSQNVTPEALLYLYARHALMLGYYDTSYELHRAAGVLTDVELAALKAEPPFVHVADQAQLSESRLSMLYKTQAAITGSPTQLVSEYITRNYRSLSAAHGFTDQIDALTRLADASTAQLERAFVEHIDLCSYRFDAWALGLVNFQLQQMRSGGGENGSATGVYLGAYAWLEDLRPSAASLAPAQLPDDTAVNFPGAAPILHDSTNGGFIHAPSLTHARAAAILRAGYLANASPSNPGTLSVNLSSGRVRQALSMLEGMRNGQSLGALLGYQFERGLHDAHNLAEVDKFIYPLRKAFPLVADSLASTKTLPNVPIQAIEARNVFDGRKLVARIASSGVRTYPYGLTDLPGTTSAAEAEALNAQTDALLDASDAIADLALAEGVYQASQGNFERIAATLEAYSVGNFPPDPQVVRTPSEGAGLTHRVALHLQAGLTAAAGTTPRSQAQPALDAWVSGVLPPSNKVGCVVKWAHTDGTPRHQDVLFSDLALAPLDLLTLVNPEPSQAMGELDDRVIRFVLATNGTLRPDATLNIAYMSAPAGAFSVFEVSALLRSLATVLRGGRPLKATDATLSQSATPEADEDVFIDRTRVAVPKAALDVATSDLAAYLAALTPLLADPVANRAALINGIDALIDDAVALLERASRFGLPQSGWGFAYGWRHDVLRDLLASVADLVGRWNAKATDVTAKLDAYALLPGGTPNADRFVALRAAELVISTQPAPLPAFPSDFLTTVKAKFDLFKARLNDVVAATQLQSSKFVDFLNAVNALLPAAELDAVPFDTTSFGDRAVRLAQDLAAIVNGHQTDATARALRAQAQLDAHDVATTPSERVTALQAGAKAIFGDDFLLLPEFALASSQADEWSNAMASSQGGALLSYLKTTAQIDFPVEEWLSSVARVRPTMHAWESMLAFTSALGRTEPNLVPVQFPYEATAPWLAMQIPPSYKLESDRLLYTAHYTVAFDKTARQCGLLLDEWSELVPATTHTTGLTFHYNRPDSEPPQAILLVTPASNTGHWVWDDIVRALMETLDLAKKRAVEPSQLDSTPYAPLLPATVMAATLHGITISTSLSVANGVMRSAELNKNA